MCGKFHNKVVQISVLTQLHCLLSTLHYHCFLPSPLYVTEEMLGATFPRILSKRPFSELWFLTDFNDTVSSAHLPAHVLRSSGNCM